MTTSWWEDNYRKVVIEQLTESHDKKIAVLNVLLRINTILERRFQDAIKNKPKLDEDELAVLGVIVYSEELINFIKNSDINLTGAIATEAK